MTVATAVLAVNWLAYAGAVVAGAHTVFSLPLLQLAAAVMLIPVLPAMLALSVASGGQVRLFHGGGTQDPVALTGMVAASVGLMFLFLDTHTTLGPRMAEWSAVAAVAGGALWVALDWKRLRAVRPALIGLLQGAGELEVPEAIFDALQAGTAVEVCMRRGALGIPWVDEVRVSRTQ